MESLHWTYCIPPNDAALQQGDIIRPNSELKEVLGQVHPHFNDAKYVAYLITTQSCDLVCRKGKPCATKYINIAVVRELSSVVFDLLETVCKTNYKGVYPKEKKGDAKNLLERIINQNEQGLGLFYLHNQAKFGYATNAVAMLRVTIALRRDHYDLLLRSRTGALEPAFQAKLGWLVGNLYSRVGTEDWTEEERPKELQAIIKEIFETQVFGDSIQWVPQDTLAAVLEGQPDITREALIQACEAYKKSLPRDSILDVIQSQIKEVIPEVTEDALRKIKQRIANDPIFNKATRAR